MAATAAKLSRLTDGNDLDGDTGFDGARVLGIAVGVELRRVEVAVGIDKKRRRRIIGVARKNGATGDAVLFAVAINDQSLLAKPSRCSRLVNRLKIDTNSVTVAMM